jgi:hypothetical protein
MGAESGLSRPQADAAETGLAAWHAYMAAPTPAALRAMIAPDAVFHSPVVHTAQAGADKVFAYLWAAAGVLGNDSFAYARELTDGDQACLEFTCTLGDVQVNGIDLIRWDEGDERGMGSDGSTAAGEHSGLIPGPELN